MNTFYLILSSVITLYLILLHNRQEPEHVDSSIHCDPHKNLCIACPELKPNSKSHIFNKYLQISAQMEFYALGVEDHFIMKNQCRDMLQIFEKDQKGQWKLPESLTKDIQEKKAFIANSHSLFLAQGQQHHLTLYNTPDFIIFYEGLSATHLLILKQNEQNPQKLMSLSRCISWGMLFALLLKVIDRKLGLLTIKKPCSIPFIEIIILWINIQISYDVESFKNLFISQLMLLAYVLVKVIQKIRRKIKLIGLVIFAIFGMACLIREEIVVFADLACILCIKLKYPNLKQSSQQIKTAITLIFFCLVANTFRSIGSLNSLVYSAFASRLIIIPFSFLLFQQPSIPQEQIFNQKNNNSVYN